MAELISNLADVPLTGGMQVAFEAIDPTSGAAVTGVKVSAVAIYGETDNVSAADSGTDVLSPFMLLPGPEN